MQFSSSTEYLEGEGWGKDNKESLHAKHTYQDIEHKGDG